METQEVTNRLLKNKYELHKSPEVKAAAERHQARTGEKVPQDPLARIENYLNRFHEIIDIGDSKEREYGIKAIKRLILSKYVTRFEDIPESYWKSQERVIRERGQQGDYNRFSEEEKNKWKKELSEGILGDQRASLEQWIDYLASSESANIPDPMKYWIFRSIVDMQEFDKETHEFPKRSKGTIKMFPDINEEALNYVVNAVVGKYKGGSFDFEQFDFDLTDEAKTKFKNFLSSENFTKLYAWANEYIQPISDAEIKITDGQWVKYAQDAGKTENYKQLSQFLRGRGTGWCTAGEFTARTQLKGGDFYVYYSNDTSGNPVNPRIAIRMEQEKIAEIRGIAAKQNLDPYMNDVLATKLKDFPDKDQYLKKEADMKCLTEIDNKTRAGFPLTREDLIFLYEIDFPIEGFGNENLGVSDDSRIAELRLQRDLEKDMLIVFNCEKSQIAGSPREINENTKAYVGSLLHYDKNGEIIPVFKLFQKHNIKQVYTSFPEGRIRFEELTIGGKTKEQLIKEMRKKGITIFDFAEDMLKNPDFTTLKQQKILHTVKLKVADLGLSQDEYLTTDQIYQGAKDLGLDICPAEAGPHRRLKDLSQPLSDYYRIAMKPITGRRGYPSVFDLARNDRGLWLRDFWAGPDYGWALEDRFVFGLSK